MSEGVSAIQLGLGFVIHGKLGRGVGSRQLAEHSRRRCMNSRGVHLDTGGGLFGAVLVCHYAVETSSPLGFLRPISAIERVCVVGGLNLQLSAKFVWARLRRISKPRLTLAQPCRILPLCRWSDVPLESYTPV